MKNKLKFLLVDDNEIDGLITSKLLEIHLHPEAIQYTDSCEKGLNWLKTTRIADDEVVVILLDIRMPGIGGFEFLQLLDEMDTSITNKVQVIMLSSTLNPADYQLAEENNYVKKLLSKPVPAKELLQYIDTD